MIGPAFPEVLAAARVRAPWALERIYRDLCGPVTGYLRLHDAADPDDTASEAFLGVLTGIGSFSGDERAFRAWVFTVAHRRLVDEWRRAGRRPQLADVDDAVLAQRAGGDVEAEALLALSAQRVRALCEGLAPDQRSVLLLRILGDLTVEQVAQVLGRSPGAVKQLQRRALRAVRVNAERAGVPLRDPAAMTEVT
ncbi:RNA polymerase sigma factor [Quadrisphaera sp. DSM 44207]|uniref:RNA polymerase sigma factor n=1 Tax=Quadrisphaera sp. DSM 44207 TaxID=1881057 RepID=UPI000891C13A|nr:sigma-70 family RNA polymerase sigma factor [Quadrisphaera sp. DSM 44207]SDQ06152.1 RNA polymerase sigma-70 factor, ECF subfamily [Quadrisphaera sp. DSM 44207]